MGLVIYYSKGLTGVLFELKCKMKNKDNHSHLSHSQSPLTLVITNHSHHSQSTFTVTVIHIKFRTTLIYRKTITLMHTQHPTSNILFRVEPQKKYYFFINFRLYVNSRRTFKINPRLVSSLITHLA
jgi:hypothetical protein